MVLDCLKKLIRCPLEVSSPDAILPRIAEAPCVSFDVFDTLLKRAVPRPHDVFRRMGEEMGDAAFAARRIAAEQAARREAVQEEITLADIYARLPESEQALARMELATERAVSRPNAWLAPVLRACAARHARILAVSDMYLPQSFVAELLARAGIQVERLFVSSAYGRQKGTGNLFRLVLRTEGLAPGDVVHIGDALRADYFGARKAGIRSILIPRDVPQDRALRL